MFIFSARFPRFLARPQTRTAVGPKGRQPGFRRARLERLEQRQLLAVFTVNSFEDTVDEVPGDGVPADAFGNTTLRAAVMEANALAGDDTVLLGSGTFSFQIWGTNEDAAATGDLDITDTSGSLIITGARDDSTIIMPAGRDRAFDITPGAVLNLSGLTISGGGYEIAYGGGIRNTDGILNLTDSVISDCRARIGGGIYNELGTVDVRNSVFSDCGTAICTGGGAISSLFGTVTLRGSTISGGFAASSGGAISSDDSTLTVLDSVIADNYAEHGGGIAADGTLIIVNTTLSGNQARSQGGGIFNLGSMELLNTTIMQNTAACGGGILNIGHATIVNCTLSGNAAQVTTPQGTVLSWAGGIYNEGTGELRSTTITQNAAEVGGGVFDAGDLSSSLVATNTIIADNTASQANPDLEGVFTSGGHNLIGSVGTAFGFIDGVNGDRVGSGIHPIDPLLGPLADNGGPTLTHALLLGSPAIDAGDNADAPVTDQRGLARVADGDNSGTATIDIGAFERSALDPVIADAATHVGTVDYWNSGAVDATSGLLAFTLEAVRDGTLTVVLRQGTTAATEMGLYVIDATGQLIGPLVGGGRERIDFDSASAGSRYLLVILGLDSSPEIIAANLVQRSADTVNVYGTGTADHFRFDALAQPQVEINGVEYQVLGVQTILFDGLEGSDDARLIGSGDADTAILFANKAVLQGNGYTVVATNIESKYFNGGGGIDAARLYGTRRGETFTAGVATSEADPLHHVLSGDGISTTAAAEKIYVFGRDGEDTATISLANDDSILPFWKRTRVQAGSFDGELRDFVNVQTDSGSASAPAVLLAEGMVDMAAEMASEGIAVADLAQLLWMDSGDRREPTMKKNSAELDMLDQMFGCWE